MIHRIVLFLVLLCLAVSAEARMVRVIEVIDGRTLIVESKGVRETIKLAGIEVIDEWQARALLNWTLANSWVMLEQQGGAYDIYRSPDALFINRELVLRGFARATRTGIEPPPTTMVTYLGIGAPAEGAKKKERKISATARRTDSGTRRRSSGRSSRSSPAKPKTSPPAAPENQSTD